MECVGGNEHHALHALLLDVHGGGHAGEHLGVSVQGDHGGILGDAGHGGADFGNLRHGAGVNLVADGADGNLGALPQLQGENVGLVHRHADGELLVRRHGGQNQLRAVIGIDHGVRGQAGDLGHDAVNGGGGAAILKQLQQGGHGLLRLAAAAEQGVVVHGIVGIRQGKQVSAGVDLAVFLGGDPADGSGIAGDGQGVADFQGTGAQHLAGFIQHGGLGLVFRAVVGEVHHGLAGDAGFHGSGIADAAGLHGNGLVILQISFNGDGHQSVQGENGQRAVLHHHIHHAVAHLGVYPLDPAGDGGADIAVDGILFGLADLVVQLLQLGLHIRQGGHHGVGIHPGDDITGGERISR